jgi:hypothetical protein
VATVRKVKASVLGDYAVYAVQLVGDDEQTVCKAETGKCGKPQTIELEPGEQVIGIYGVQSKFVSVQIGFIVWRPPNSF